MKLVTCAENCFSHAEAYWKYLATLAILGILDSDIGKLSRPLHQGFIAQDPGLLSNPREHGNIFWGLNGTLNGRDQQGKTVCH